MQPIRVLFLTALCALPLASSAATTPALTTSGRLLDLTQSYAFFSNGDAYPLAPQVVIQDARTHRRLTVDEDVTAQYAQASFSENGQIVELDMSSTPLPNVTGGKPPDDVRRFAVAASAPKPNPEFGNQEGFTGEPVLVVFLVEVPPSTSFTDAVYFSTQASGWDPMEMRMDRVDALHFRITRTLASGTKFVYRYTRGTWRSAERQENGLEGPPHTYIVQNLDVARRKDTVYHWGDENPSGGTIPGPNAIPTPQTGRPFQFRQ